MLRDLAGLDKTERTMAHALINNERSIDKVADALMLQHARLHRSEENRARKGPGINKNSIGFSIGVLICFGLLVGWISEVENEPKVEQQLDQK